VTSKWDVVAALKKSGLPTSDRIIMMMLVDVADADTAIVPEQWTPSLTELAEWTGLGRSTVATRLKELEKLGWVKRARPAIADAIVHSARTCYHLAIGQAVEKAKAARPGKGRHGKSGSAAEPVQPLNQDTTQALVQPLNQSGSAVEPPPVQPLNQGGSAAGHKNHPPTGGGSTHHSHQDPPPPASPPSANDAAATLPGFEHTEQPPPKRKRTAKPKSDKTPTEGQRINTLAKRYTDRVKLSPFHSVRGVVQTAVRTGEYTDEQIAAGIDRLVQQRKSVTANTLRIAIEGDQSRPPDWRDVSGQDHSGWTKRADNRAVSTPDAISTGWTRKGTTQ